MKIPVYYDERMAVRTNSFSPSSYKPKRVVQDWITRDLPIEIRAVKPELPTLAHDPRYIERVMMGDEPNGFNNKEPLLNESLRWTNGAIITAAQDVVASPRRNDRLVACAPASGFHHAGWARGHGFCTFNGLVQAAIVAGWIVDYAKVAILDCDYHYGDGTDDILSRRLFAEAAADAKVPVAIRHWSAGAYYTRPEEADAFLAALPGIVEALLRGHVQALIYQAGADPHVDDPLGGFLTTAQLLERDRIVFKVAARRHINVIWTLAGGYQSMPTLLEIHRNTLLAALENP